MSKVQAIIIPASYHLPGANENDRIGESLSCNSSLNLAGIAHPLLSNSYNLVANEPSINTSTHCEVSDILMNFGRGKLISNQDTVSTC
jgi:hypothetical protein